MFLSSGSPGSILFARRPAPPSATRQRPGTDWPPGSGGRYSMRLAFGLSLYVGMRMAAERLRALISQVHRRFIAGHQALVAVGRRIANGAERSRMLQAGRRCNTAPSGKDPAYSLPAKSGLPFFHKDWCVCMPRAVVAKERLGHESQAVLPCFLATFLTTYL